MEKVRQGRTIGRLGLRRAPARRLVERAALLAAPPPPTLDHTLTEASQRLVGEARNQGMLVIGLCAAFSLIGLLMMMQGGARIGEARQAEGWTTTQGVIEISDVYAAPGAEGGQWRPFVSYSYAVNGRPIYSTRIALGKPRLESSREAVLAYLTRYPVGSRVTVHYDPTQITQSVLETGTPVSAVVNLLFGCVLALMGPTLLAMFRRSAADRSRWMEQADPAGAG